MKLIVKILIALALVGILLLGIGILSGGELYAALQDGKLVTLQSAAEQLDRDAEPIPPNQDYDYYDITIKSGSCTIKTGRYLAYSDDVDAYIHTDNAIIFTVSSEDAEIVLPAHRLPSLKLYIEDALVHAEDLYSDDLQISCRNGTLSIKESKANICAIVAQKANLYIDDCDASQIQIRSEQSDLTLDLDGDPRDYYCISENTDSTITWDGKPLDQIKFGSTSAPRALTFTVTESQITFDP